MLSITHKLRDRLNTNIDSVAMNKTHIVIMYKDWKMTLMSIDGKVKKIIKDNICCIAMNEKYIVSGYNKDNVYQAKIWDINEIINSKDVAINKDSLSPKVIEHKYSLKSVAIQGNKIVTLTSDTKEPILIYELNESGELIKNKEERIQVETVRTLLAVDCIATYKNLIAYGTANQKLSIWDMDKGKSLDDKETGLQVKSIAMNKNCVVTEMWQEKWDRHDGNGKWKVIRKYMNKWKYNNSYLSTPTELVNGAFVVMNDNYIVTATEGGKIHLFNATENEITNYKISSRIYCISMYSDYIVIVHRPIKSDNKIEIWKIEDGATENSGSGSKFKYLLKY